jgi:hypothetical protein
MHKLSQSWRRIILYRILGVSTGFGVLELLNLTGLTSVSLSENLGINAVIETVHTFLHWCVERKCKD